MMFVYMIQGRGSHVGEIPKGEKRANSTLSVEQEKLLRFALNQGGKPAGIHVCKGDHDKVEDGELEGVGCGADPISTQG